MNVSPVAAHALAIKASQVSQEKLQLAELQDRIAEGERALMQLQDDDSRQQYEEGLQ